PPPRIAPSRPGLPEDRRELGGKNDLELVVAAVRRPLVGTPAHEDGRVPEAGALQGVVLHLAHPLDAGPLPGEGLTPAPPPGRAGHPGPAVDRARPLPPGV